MDITNKSLKPFLFAAALITTTASIADRAEATLVLTLQSGASTVVVAGNGIGDLDLHLGMIGFMGAVGNFSTNMVGGVGGAMAPWPTLMDLHGMNMSGSGGGKLIVTLEDDGYVPAGAFSNFHSMIGGTVAAGGMLTSQSFYDPSATNAVLGSLIADHGTATSGAFASEISSGWIPSPGPYGIGIQLTITHAGAALTSYDHEIRIAEPATLALFGLMLAGVGVLLGRRHRCRY